MTRAVDIERGGDAGKMGSRRVNHGDGDGRGEFFHRRSNRFFSSQPLLVTRKKCVREALENGLHKVHINF